ncbi:Multiple drug resistance-associated protein-like transporter 1 [Candida viswanathii]|uniref:Multiple drug resistance-associated protein-like transporter 1 n=1 Tax=Candida viswanathii TaxID=5486 RepID=A0A367YCK0_9ASCO|nr:Multiple drug resistance-associated protein-like transporter 1 [Candida viswanathii]
MNGSTDDKFILGFVPIQLSLFTPHSLLHTFDFLGSHGTQDVSVVSTELTIPSPLYSPHGNALNPQFVEYIGKIVNGFFALFMLVQLYRLTLARKTPLRIYTATPTLQSFKTFLVLVQIVLTVSLFQLSKNAYFISGITTVLLTLVLELVEFRRSPVAIASLLLYWFVNTLFSFGVFIQDSYSKHKIYANSGPAYVIETVALVNSLAIFVLEVGFYKPGFETTNEKFLDTVNLFSYFTFYYLQPLIDKIYATDDVKLSDLPDILGELTCDATKAKVSRAWEEQLKKSKKASWLSSIWAFITRKKVDPKPNMFGAIAKAFADKFVISITLAIVGTALSFAQPFLLRKFIQFFTSYFYSEEKPPIIIGYFWAGVMFLTSIANFITFNQAFKTQFDLGYEIQSSLTTMIYEKALNLSPQSRKNKPTGDVINHITMDIDTIFWFCWQLGEYLASPLKLAVCLVSLHSLFYNATWAGVITAVVVAPLATLVNTSISKNYIQMMKDKDDRTSLVTEILNSAKSIKFYSWEKPILARLGHIRNNRELANIKKIGVVSALGQFLWSCIPFFISCSTYATFAIFYKVPLTPDIIFPALALFDLLMEPMLLIPGFIVMFIQVTASLARIGEFLTLDELADDQHGHVKRDPEPSDNSTYSVVVKDATFVWSEEKAPEYKDEESEVQDTPTSNVALKDINFLAKKSELTCVVGKVGSGKSTLVKAILGDVPIKIPKYSDDAGSGPTPCVETFGSIAYCPQNPWILNGTVKENILFGHKYESEFYKKTVDACELVSDFKNLPDGDKTVVGEKGISLSGGQKARISLARSVYARADIYLLDDILSAVDAHVGKNIIRKVLSNEGVIGNRCRVLATNSVPVLHEANDIYLLSGGSIVEHGNYDAVMSKGGDLATLIKEYGRKKDESSSPAEEETTEEAKPVTKEDEEPTITAEEAEGLVDEIVEYVGEENRGVVEGAVLRRASVVSYGHNYEDDEVANGEPRKTRHEEEVSRKGTVPWKTFKQYIVACDYKYFSFYIAATLTVVLVSASEKYLLSYWSQLNSEQNDTVNPVFFLGSYAALGVFAGFLTYLGALVIWSYCIVKGAAYFHNKMAESVLRSPMSFFDTTPVGRILNRFTEDIGKIDMNLPWTIIPFVTILLNGIVTFGVILTFLPPMILIIVALLFVYNYFRVRFVPTTRELKRLESIAKSPVLATIQESINGVDTIKAFHQRERFIHKSKKYIDEKTLIGVVQQNCNRWLSMRLQSISSSIMFFTALLAVVTLGGKHPILPSILGFVMTYSMSVTGILNSLVKIWADIQSEGVAIERIIEYCDLPSEAPMIVEDKRPADTWPAEGVVKFKKYSTAYREHLDPVLREIELTINSKERIGIVGRTGAGKSSLTLGLFRIIEATGGNIEIDGVDTSVIGLYDLRHHLTIIPQEAHTFRASVRENLDPFGEYNDDKLWRALELAHLKEHVAKMETEPLEDEKKNSKNPDELPKKTGLDAQIEEGGSNLSAGQKQLLCLARALLNETSKILVLDEATAAVDFQTDKIIQETIRSEFKDKTILTIAHRIDTILDSDKILVLDQGKVAEFDSPENLLKNKDSIFYSLAKEGGYID